MYDDHDGLFIIPMFISFRLMQKTVQHHNVIMVRMCVCVLGGGVHFKIISLP